jgi:hypothetical protein
MKIRGIVIVLFIAVVIVLAVIISNSIYFNAEKPIGKKYDCSLIENPPKDTISFSEWCNDFQDILKKLSKVCGDTAGVMEQCVTIWDESFPKCDEEDCEEFCFENGWLDKDGNPDPDCVQACLDEQECGN